MTLILFMVVLHGCKDLYLVADCVVRSYIYTCMAFYCLWICLNYTTDFHRKLGLELYVAWRANQIERTNSITPPHTSVRHDVSRRTERNTSPVVFMSGQPHITKKNKVSLTLSEAATKIQRFWRRHIDIQVWPLSNQLIQTSFDDLLTFNACFRFTNIIEIL